MEIVLVEMKVTHGRPHRHAISRRLMEEEEEEEDRGNSMKVV